MKSSPRHYDQSYFKYQEKIGEFGGQANLFKFVDFIKPTDTVLDFGCGGGYLLKNITCQKKLGIEINLAARLKAKTNKVHAFDHVKKIKNNSVDVIISNHALEHTFSPLTELKNLHPKLKKTGRIVFVVPHEVKMSWKAGDVNQHLYTWSPMNIGNLFTTAGFTVEKVETIKHRWPPFYMEIRKIVGQTLFDVICKIYSRVDGSWFQVRVVAHKNLV